MNPRKYILTAIAFSLSAVAFAGDPRAGADVVGRDLNIWGLGAVGHVGIWTGSSVLEVLNEGSIIYQKSLADFKSRSPFWGARYGIGANRAASIVSAGWNQRNFSPAYTTTASWREGGLTERVCIQYDAYGQCVRYVNRVTTALFRCDTFVNFSFLKGNGAKLVNGGILPRIVYNSQPYSR